MGKLELTLNHLSNPFRCIADVQLCSVSLSSSSSNGATTCLLPNERILHDQESLSPIRRLYSASSCTHEWLFLHPRLLGTGQGRHICLRSGYHTTIRHRNNRFLSIEPRPRSRHRGEESKEASDSFGSSEVFFLLNPVFRRRFRERDVSGYTLTFTPCDPYQVGIVCIGHMRWDGYIDAALKIW